MDIINISKKKYNELEPLNIPDTVLSTEADLYNLSYQGKDMIFKNLYKTQGKIFANKLYTLELLDMYRDYLPKSLILPSKLCSVNSQIAGFTIPYVDGYTMEDFDDDPKVDLKTKIYYFKAIGILLEQLSHMRKNANIEFYIGDLHASNFMIDKKSGELKVVDLDSCKIGDNQPFPARYLSPFGLYTKVPTNKYDIMDENEEPSKYKYNKSYEYNEEFGCIVPNENSDLYCYAISFLNFLSDMNINGFELNEFADYLYYLDKIGFNRELIDSFYKIITSANNDNFYPLLDSITEEQAARANKKVYKIAKNKKY